jgi:cytochrome c oxidase subunit II
MRRTALVLLALALPAAGVVAALFLPGIGPPRTVTDSGRTIHEVYWVVFALAAIVFVLIEAALIAFVIRFRRRRETAEGVEGPQIHGNTRIEIIWTAIPAILLLGLSIYMLARVPDVEANPPSSGSGSGETLEIDVTARQFYWQYEYPNGAISYDALYVPVDATVTLRLESTDVAHSWWVPDLTGKRDAIPGRVNRVNFRATETGFFEHGVCGEFCGTQHAQMRTEAHVLAADEFDQWLADNEPALSDDATAALGETQWAAACAKCHGLAGEGGYGPAIAGNSTLVNADALRQLLNEGQDLEGNPGYMPPVGRGWTDEQIASLIAFVESSPDLAPQGGGR